MASEHKEIEFTVDTDETQINANVIPSETTNAADEGKVSMTAEQQLEFVRMISASLRRDNTLIVDAINHWNKCSVEDCQREHGQWPVKSNELIEQSKLIANEEELFAFRVNVYIPFVIRSILNPLFLMMIPSNEICVEFIGNCLSQSMNWMMQNPVNATTYRQFALGAIEALHRSIGVIHSLSILQQVASNE